MMGGRYYITGTQLGMLLAFIESDENDDKAIALIKQVEETQYIGGAEQFSMRRRKT